MDAGERATLFRSKASSDAAVMHDDAVGDWCCGRDAVIMQP